MYTKHTSLGATPTDTMPVEEPAASLIMLAFSCFDEVSFK